jgi:hypothetical protein
MDFNGNPNNQEQSRGRKNSKGTLFCVKTIQQNFFFTNFLKYSQIELSFFFLIFQVPPGIQSPLSRLTPPGRMNAVPQQQQQQPQVVGPPQQQGPNQMGQFNGAGPNQVRGGPNQSTQQQQQQQQQLPPPQQMSNPPMSPMSMAIQQQQQRWTATPNSSQALPPPPPPPPPHQVLFDYDCQQILNF